MFNKLFSQNTEYEMFTVFIKKNFKYFVEI